MNEQEVVAEIIAVVERMLDNGEEIPADLMPVITSILEQNILSKRPIESIPQGADLLWILSGENPQAFQNYLRTVPDPAMNALAKNPAQMAFVIKKLQQDITMPAGEVSEGIPRAPLKSSNIYGFQYDPRNKRLMVKFQGDGIYEYEGVPPHIFKIFQAGAIPCKTSGHNEYGAWWRGKNPSLGASLYSLIKQGGYPYQKVA